MTKKGLAVLELLNKKTRARGVYTSAEPMGRLGMCELVIKFTSFKELLLGRFFVILKCILFLNEVFLITLKVMPIFSLEYFVSFYRDLVGVLMHSKMKLKRKKKFLKR